MANVLSCGRGEASTCGKLSLCETTVTLDAKSSSDLEWLPQMCKTQSSHPGVCGDGGGDGCRVRKLFSVSGRLFDG